MDTLRQAKEAAVKSCNEQRIEVDSLTEQLGVTKQKLATTRQQLQVTGILFAKSEMWPELE